jgi:RND family efflux transporter MFP subunit
MLFLPEPSDHTPRTSRDSSGMSHGTDAVRGNGHPSNGHSAAGEGIATEVAPHAPTNGKPAAKDLRAAGKGRIAGLKQRVALRVWRRFPNVTRLQRRVIVVLLTVAVLGVVVAAGTLARTVLAGTPGVVYTTAGPSKITNQPGGVGTLDEAPNESFTVSLNLAGVQDSIFSISQVDVTNGAEVAIGTPLVQIDPTLLVQNAPQFVSQLASAQQALVTAEHTPPSASTTPQSQAQQITALTEQVTYDQELVAIAQGKTTTISSPTTGFVTGLVLQPGQVVKAGEPILEVLDPAVVDVSASLLLSDIQTISPGDGADVAPTGLPGVRLHGTVLTVSAISSGGGLDGTVIIQAQNTAPNPVPIGTQVFVHVMATQSAAVTVPAVAVMNSDLDPAVFVLRHGHAYIQSVSLGASDANRIQIKSGVRAGDMVVESNMQSLTNGERVRVLGNP